MHLIKDKTTGETFAFPNKNKAEKKYNQIRKQGHKKEAWVNFGGDDIPMWVNTWNDK